MCRGFVEKCIISSGLISNKFLCVVVILALTEIRKTLEYPKTGEFLEIKVVNM